jgi:hypothetical protein
VKPAALERLRCPRGHALQSFGLSAAQASGEARVREVYTLATNPGQAS